MTTPEETTGSKLVDKFEPPGINFKAKVIGIVDVPEARGDQMCLENMGKLKAIVKEKGEHKQRIVVNVSLEGIKIIDEKTLGLNFTHEVHKISFISRDPTDRRAFGYVYGDEGQHKFYAIKTGAQADQLVLSLKELFEAVLELKQQQASVQKQKIEETTVYLQTSYDAPIGAPSQKKQQNGGIVLEQVTSEATDSALYAVPHRPTSPGTAEGEKQRALSSLVDLEKEMKTIQEGISTMSDFDLAFEATNTNQDNPFGAASDPFAPAPAAQPAAVARPAQPAPANASQDLFSVTTPTASTTMPTSKSSDDLFAEFSDTFTSPAVPAPSMPMPTQPPPPNPFAAQAGGFGGAGAGFGAPAGGFGAPAAGGFGAPAGGFGAPAGGFGQPAAFQSSGFQQQQPAPAAFQSAWGPPQPQAQQQPAMGGFGAPMAGQQQKPTSDPFGGGFGGSGGGFDAFTLQPQSTAPPPGQQSSAAGKPDPFGDIAVLGGGSKPAPGGKKQDPFKGFKMAKPGEVAVPDFKMQDPFGAPAAGGNKGITTSDGKPLFDDSPFGF